MEQWLNSIGLADYIPAFRDNRISADQLRKLTDADLRELGLTIGERLRFRASLAELGRDPAPEIDAAEQSAGSAAERRPLTIMFVDLIGSSNIGNRLDPEDLMEVYKTYRELCGQAISASGGHTARFIGDGILAYCAEYRRGRYSGGQSLAHQGRDRDWSRASHQAVCGRVIVSGHGDWLRSQPRRAIAEPSSPGWHRGLGTDL
jgi:class 3 adenylate cyclase